MQRRPLGRSGLETAPLMLGGNVFGWTADKATSFDILDEQQAIEDATTTVEDVLSRALGQGPARERVVHALLEAGNGLESGVFSALSLLSLLDEEGLDASELAEFPLVCDRVLTLYGGRLTAELPGAAADEGALLRAMHGLVEEEGAAA